MCSEKDFCNLDIMPRLWWQLCDNLKIKCDCVENVEVNGWKGPALSPYYCHWVTGSTLELLTYYQHTDS